MSLLLTIVPFKLPEDLRPIGRFSLFCPFIYLTSMPAVTFSDNAQVLDTAGAINDDMNVATAAGALTLTAGVGLGFAAGAIAMPAPVLGISALGGGLVIAGQWNEIKDHFTGDDADKSDDADKLASADADTVPVTVPATEKTVDVVVAA